MQMNIPSMYEGLGGYNIYQGSRGTAGLVENDLTTRYCMRSLYQRLYAGYIPENPSTWNVRYFKHTMFNLGFIGIIDTPKYGIIPQIAMPSGELGLYLQPTKMLVSQPLVQFEGTRGVNCEFLNLTPDWLGIQDIVEFWAKRLSIAMTSLDVALINSRVAFIGIGKNKSATETLKIIYEKISAGQPLVVVDKELKDESLDGKNDPIWTYSADVKQNYIVTDLLADIKTIIEMFDHEIGIAAIGEKKERMITDEVGQLTSDSCARSETWFDCLTASYDAVNDLFPELNLSFTLKYGSEVHRYGEERDTIMIDFEKEATNGNS